MKTKTKELTGLALDWAVAKCEGYTNLRVNPHHWDNALLMDPPRVEYGPVYLSDIAYSTDWAQGGPILTRERISRIIDHSGLWVAYWTEGYDDSDEGKQWMQCDRSELVAGLRCYVASILGDEVEIPGELA
jgi:hypothetical protein